MAFFIICNAYTVLYKAGLTKPAYRAFFKFNQHMEFQMEEKEMDFERTIRTLTDEDVRHSLTCDEHSVCHCELGRLEQYFLQRSENLKKIDDEIRRLNRLKAKIKPLIEHVEEAIIELQRQNHIHEWQTEDGLHQLRIRSSSTSVIAENIETVSERFKYIGLDIETLLQDAHFQPNGKIIDRTTHTPITGIKTKRKDDGTIIIIVEDIENVADKFKCINIDEDTIQQARRNHEPIDGMRIVHKKKLVIN